MTNALGNKLPPSELGKLFGQTVTKQAEDVAGTDGRLTPNEAGKNELVADMYSKRGAQSPTTGGLGKFAAKLMETEAAKIAGPDGQVDASTAKRLPGALADFAAKKLGTAEPRIQTTAPVNELRQVMRELSNARTPSGLAQAFANLAERLDFMSESDDPYLPLMVEIPADAAVTKKLVRDSLPWDARGQAPNLDNLSLDSGDNFWNEQAIYTESKGERLDFRGLDYAMKSMFGASRDAEDHHGFEDEPLLWVATPNVDNGHDDYYLFGVLKTGEGETERKFLVGLDTDRVWT